MLNPTDIDHILGPGHWSDLPSHPTPSSIHRWYKQSQHVIKKRTNAGVPDMRGNRTAVALGSICFLIWLQTFVTIGSNNAFDIGDRASHQILVSELPNLEPGEVRSSTSRPMIVKSHQPNESSDSLPMAPASAMLQFAKNTASKVCNEEHVQEQANIMILVKVPGEDASVYFSLEDKSMGEATQGGFLFGCPETQGQRHKQQRIDQSQATQVLINGPRVDQRDTGTSTNTRRSSWRSSGWTALCNIALAVLTAVMVRWCSAHNPESKKKVVPVARETRPKTSRTQSSTKLGPSAENATKTNANTIIMPSPAVQSTEIASKTNEEIVNLGLENRLRLYSLETQLGDATRAVDVRRQIVTGKVRSNSATSSFDPSGLPAKDYDYGRVMGACCENVIGYLPVPMGVAGPLNMNGKQVFIPMATTEGALVASTNRGCTAINESGGVTSLIMADGMTRGPCVRFPNLERAGAAKLWLDTDVGFQTVAEAFNSTSRFGRLQNIKTAIAGSDLFIRFKAKTGDAMGMNMISKGVERALAALGEAGFDDLRIVSLSGNYCTDKKAAAINWVDGRGKSVAAQATISAATLKNVLKVDVDSMVELNTSKNLVGSCLAGSIGGNNAHGANIVAAAFLATGQDIAQVVESSSCLTTMRNVDGNLQISVAMPSIEVGTVGGGTVLEAQGTMLDLLGVRGADAETPGGNAQELARIVAAGVLAGELSLCSALAAGSLVKSHMILNRK